MRPLLGLGLLLPCARADLSCHTPTDGTCHRRAAGGAARRAEGLDVPTSLLQTRHALVIDRGASGFAGDPDKPPAAPPKWRTTNGAMDLSSFFAAMRFDVLLLVLWVAAFTLLQRRYPKTYAWRATHLWSDADARTSLHAAIHAAKPPEEQAQLHEKCEGPYHWTDEAMKNLKEVEDFDTNNFYPAPRQYCRWNPANPTWFGWIKASLYTTNEYVEETCGLDAAMLLKFTEMAIRMMLVVSVPLVCGFMPIYLWGGGAFAGDDYLSHAGIDNVVFNHTRADEVAMSAKTAAMLPRVQWIYWLVAFAVWFVVIYVQWELFHHQREFMVRRRRWLLAMPKPRSTTLLVEGIPDGPYGCCTDDALKKRFEELVGQGTVEQAFVVKKLRPLEDMIDEWNSLKSEKAQAEKALEKAEFYDKKKDIQKKVDECTRQMNEKAVKIADFQSKLYPLMAKPPAEQVYSSGGQPWDPQIIYARNGFVTFKKREDAELALKQKVACDGDECVMSCAPDPTDVIYHDLDVDDTKAFANGRVGVGFIVALFLSVVPIVAAIGTRAGVLSSIGLTITMSFLPILLHLIFKKFFTLRASRWSQLELQNVYFWFLVVFVLLVTSVGANMEIMKKTIVEKPFSVFSLLANRMPLTANFYMLYVMMQPVTHGMNLTRYMCLLKFFIFKRSHGEDEARRMSEPEDQDFYGMGARSAHFALMLLIGLVFGTICPMMNVLVLLNFLACRLIYGYLIPCAESRKCDLGGVPWCMQLKHISLGMLVYVILMTGILMHRAESICPALISSMGFVFWAVPFYKCNHVFHWEDVAYEDVANVAFVKVREPTAKEYCQYALRWKPEDEAIKEIGKKAATF